MIVEGACTYCETPVQWDRATGWRTGDLDTGWATAMFYLGETLVHGCSRRCRRPAAPRPRRRKPEPGLPLFDST